MNRGELRAARGPATVFGLDDASQRRDALAAARAIVEAGSSNPMPPTLPNRAGKERIPEARPVHSPQPGRAGRPRVLIDAEVLIGVTALLLLAVVIAGISFFARHAHGGIWQ